MKTLAVRARLVGGLFVILLSQWACGAGSQPATFAPSDGGTQATQAPVPTKGERGTPDEAKTLLQLAIDHYNQVGRDQAYTDFNSGQPPFKDRDLYVVCMAPDHTETVNGGFPQYVGVSGDSLTDDNGKPLGQAIVDALPATGTGEVNYHWVNPVSGQTEPKTLFFQKLGDDICGVGAYNP